MRVIAGRLKGRALATPSGEGIRPTSDRLRETIFNILENGLAKHGVDDVLTDARVLDLFAGTGALAIEALSRGAAYAVMVDDSADARGLQRANVETMGLGGVTRILRRDATKLGQAAPFAPFDLIFLDPPYDRGLGELALAEVVAGGWAKPGAILVFEERATNEIALPQGFALLDRRRGGEGQFLLLRRLP
ncbi:MAG: 16S rRNA (guanine(966)-N(2))-methyltransferase RsmD [Beijerinckiaceae bacterium]